MQDAAFVEKICMMQPFRPKNVQDEAFFTISVLPVRSHCPRPRPAWMSHSLCRMARRHAPSTARDHDLSRADGREFLLLHPPAEPLQVRPNRVPGHTVT